LPSECQVVNVSPGECGRNLSLLFHQDNFLRCGKTFF
jgi:hypothetical protein